MISLDQVLLLEQKVESAVAKIAQLQAENDALRSKCAELTNALSTKSEQLTTIESDQNRIESGILKALDRLNSIENSVLKAVVPEKTMEVQQISTSTTPTEQTFTSAEQVQPQLNYSSIDIEHTNQQNCEQKSFFDIPPVENSQPQNKQLENPINTQIPLDSQQDASSAEAGQFDIF